MAFFMFASDITGSAPPIPISDQKIILIYALTQIFRIK